jgi:hypothetical protein
VHPSWRVLVSLARNHARLHVLKLTITRRYCGRPVFDRMTKVAREIDWRTGEIIKFTGDEEKVDSEEERQV